MTKMLQPKTAADMIWCLVLPVVGGACVGIGSHVNDPYFIGGGLIIFGLGIILNVWTAADVVYQELKRP